MYSLEIQNLEKFVGKDLWIRYDKSLVYKDVFLRIESISKNEIEYHKISIQELTTLKYANLRKLLEHPTVLQNHIDTEHFIEYYHMKQPIEVYTTEELLQICSIEIKERRGYFNHE